MNELFLGVDGGGTKCRALVTDDGGRVLGAGLGGPANPFQHGFDITFESILNATRAALAAAALPGDRLRSLRACLGLAGANLPAILRRLEAWAHPFASLLVVTDLRAACVGAHRGEDGAVIVAGTGSCGYAVVGGRETTLGGHGFPCGDKGSGAWMGLRAVEHLLLALDGLAAPTVLGARLLAALGAGDATALVEKLGDHSAARYGALAPLVLAAAAEDDAVAAAIVRDGAAYVDALARRLLSLAPPRLSLLGGLAPLLTPWLDAAVAARLSPALEPPELGAARLALRHWREARP